MKPIPKNWKRVRRTKVYGWCSENGAHESTEVTLWLNPSASPTFNIELPEYVCKALDVPQFVTCAKADDVEPQVKSLMKRYSEWATNARAKPVIIIKAKYYGTTADGEDGLKKESFFIDSEMGHDRTHTTKAIGLQYWLAYRVNGKIHAMEYDHIEKPDAPGEYDRIPKVGWQKGDSHGCEVLDYTPELHARIDAICAAINNAVVNLHAILEADDIAKALLQLKPGTPLLPAPAKESA